MTETLFHTDSYLKEFEAVVKKVFPEMNAFILDRTAFFPGGGGQSFDTGIIISGNHEIRIKRAKTDPLGLLHILEEGQPLPEIGARVTGRIDWERRYQIMRTHTAMHILCGVIFRDFGALVTGCDMDPLKGRMDFEFESLTGVLVAVIEKSVNAEVAANHEVRVKILPREEAFNIPDLIRTKINLLPPHIQQVRTIEIVGLDLQADGGTHVKNTGEVGPMHIPDYKSKGKINKRIYVELAE
jgi:misacylated tRNA(Ala) deacylase